MRHVSRSLQGLPALALVVLALVVYSPRPVAAQVADSQHVHSEGSYPPDGAVSVPGADAIEAEVEAVLAFQQEAWNAGDIRGFMVGYARHDSLVFISGDTVRRGWQENLYAYVRSYPDRAAMGTLSFEDVRVRALAPDLALAYGVWRLDRAEDEPHGRFSLVFRRFDEGWRIIHDHTSSAD